MSFLDKFKGKGRESDRRDDDLASMFDEVVPVRPDDMVLAGVGVARVLDWNQRPGREIPGVSEILCVRRLVELAVG